jgi:hypothetical protein
MKASTIMIIVLSALLGLAAIVGITYLYGHSKGVNKQVSLDKDKIDLAEHQRDIYKAHYLNVDALLGGTIDSVISLAQHLDIIKGNLTLIKIPAVASTNIKELQKAFDDIISAAKKLRKSNEVQASELIIHDSTKPLN